MKKNYLPLIVIFVLAAPLLGKFVMARFFGPSDDQLVRQALNEAILAGREGRPGGVLEHLSNSFKINSQQPTTFDKADFIRNSRPDVSVDDPTPIVVGDTARITSDVEIKINLAGNRIAQKVEAVSMVFRREDGLEWLIVPVKKWRLEQVYVEGSAIPQLMGL
jgi:hypothetical protein